MRRLLQQYRGKQWGPGVEWWWLEVESIRYGSALGKSTMM